MSVLTAQDLTEAFHGFTWKEILDYCNLTSSQETERHYTVSCVFHKEHTPSLLLWKHNNTYRCYGCRAHGNILDFVSYLEGFVLAIMKPEDWPEAERLLHSVLDALKLQRAAKHPGQLPIPFHLAYPREFIVPL